MLDSRFRGNDVGDAVAHAIISPRILLTLPNVVRARAPESPSESPIHGPEPEGFGKSPRPLSTYRGEIPRAIRWPSRQITASDMAGASLPAAMARARSASTSPSAPSATWDKVSALPALSNSAGDFVFAFTQSPCHENRAVGGITRCRNLRVLVPFRSPMRKFADPERQASTRARSARRRSA